MVEPPADALLERVRVRLRRDPGDVLFIDGRETRVAFSPSFIRVGGGLHAEIVVDEPEVISTFPFDRWSGTSEELLEFAWRRTLNRAPIELFEVRAEDPGLPSVVRIEAPAPWATAWALNACATLRDPDTGQMDSAALVAIPAPDHWFYFPLGGNADTGVAIRFLAALASLSFEACEEKRRISRAVFKIASARPWEFVTVAEG